MNQRELGEWDLWGALVGLGMGLWFWVKRRHNTCFVFWAKTA